MHKGRMTNREAKQYWEDLEAAIVRKEALKHISQNGNGTKPNEAIILRWMEYVRQGRRDYWKNRD
jgi:hypothetical protein